MCIHPKLFHIETDKFIEKESLRSEVYISNIIIYKYVVYRILKGYIENTRSCKCITYTRTYTYKIRKSINSE